MKRKLHVAFLAIAFGMGTAAVGQRYLTEVFTNAEVTITPDVIYGTNIDFLTSNLGSPLVPANVTELQTAVTLGNPIPAAYFDPSDPGTAVKVTNTRMDIYQPDQAVDAEMMRPLMIYVHTGNALPPPVNGSPNGTRKDSSAVEMCSRMARRGYVAVSMSYRLGWNPLATTEQERRGQLLNAIYRALHDVRQCTRVMKADAAGANTYRIDPNKIIVIGEGTGGYIALANATLDDPAELYIDKFLPDPFDPTTSYVDSTLVGNLDGFNGQLCLYRPNGQNHATQFCVNMGGALADTSWLEQGDAPMVAFHTTFDPYAPFTEGIVIVPTTGGPVVPVQGSNLFMDLVNSYGNNNAFSTLSPDPFTDRARALYGTTVSHGTPVNIHSGEGLFPFVTPNWPAMNPAFREEASPWQWWDPNSAAAQTVVIPGPPPVTAGQASQASNPNFSGAKGRAYIDTIMGYMNPRIVCALGLGPCLITGVNENVAAASLVELYPNPATNNVLISSRDAIIRRYRVYDVHGRMVQNASVNAQRFVMERGSLEAGTYVMHMDTDNGPLVRKLMLD